MATLAQRLVDAGVVLSGSFRLTAGAPSGTYFSVKDAITIPDILRDVSYSLSGHVSAGKIAGVELGAVPLLVGISMLVHVPYVIIRKGDHDHGTEKYLIGNVNKGETIDMVEDVVTTGNSVLDAANLLRKEGADVSKAICVVDREDGARKLLGKNSIELVSLFTASELLRLAKAV